MLKIICNLILQPGPSEIKKIAAEGILTCLQDAIDALKQGQVPLFGWLFYDHYSYYIYTPWQWTCALDSGKNGWSFWLFSFFNLGIQQVLYSYSTSISIIAAENCMGIFIELLTNRTIFKYANLWRVSKILYWISLLHTVGVFVLICLVKICWASRCSSHNQFLT